MNRDVRSEQMSGSLLGMPGQEKADTVTGAREK